MRVLSFLPATLVVGVLGMSVSGVNAGQTVCITSADQIASDYVITRLKTSVKCGYGFKINAYEVEKPGSHATVCKIAAASTSSGDSTSTEGVLNVPAGYAIIKHKFTSRCGIGLFENAYAITKIEPGNSYGICSSSTVPDGFIITKSYFSGSCGHAFNINAGEGEDTSSSKWSWRRKDNAYLIRTASLETEVVCESSPIPKNYVKVAPTRSSKCGYGSTYNAFIIKLSNEPETPAPETDGSDADK